MISLNVLSREKRVPHLFATEAGEDADDRYLLAGSSADSHETQNLLATTWMRHLALEIKKAYKARLQAGLVVLAKSLADRANLFQRYNTGILPNIGQSRH